MLTFVMNASLTAFPHRGLSPHQFTPMSGAHKPDAVNPAIASRLHSEDPWRGVTGPERSATE
jgi:hypothetical protein